MPFMLLFKRAIIFILVLFVPCLQANELKNNVSPYLALHGNDPVNWMIWDKHTLEKAKKENKIILVSVGYFSCHWCHVMQRESYQNEEIATHLNKHFISVKVDRELNPVLDKRLIEFVQMTTGTAGWPLNVFLTPDAYPLVGTTYLSAERFNQVIKRLQERWQANPEELQDMAKNRSDTLATMLESQERTNSHNHIEKLGDKLSEVIMKSADTLQGGFGNRKFPSLPQLSALLRLNANKKNTEIDEFITLTLNQMARKGLHDDIGGGFYRYTIDPGWETPHFEKMLYTNALMPILYLQAAETYNNPEYRKVALETLEFVIDSMRGHHNAYISSLSAIDSKDQEGGYYLWTEKELNRILTDEELYLVKEVWNLTRENELPGGNLPKRDSSLETIAKHMDKPVKWLEFKLNALRTKLKNYRKRHRALPRDTKLLASQNGLLLAAFAKASSYDPKLQIYGDKLALFLQSLWKGEILYRSASSHKKGTLEDYAAVAYGLLSWGKQTGDEKATQTGLQIAKNAWQLFYQHGIWTESTEALLPKGTRLRHLQDSATPSAEYLLLEASRLSDDAELRKNIFNVLNNSTKAMETDPYGYASLIKFAVTYR